MAIDQHRERSRQTAASSKILIGFCIAIMVVVLAIAGWKLFATVTAFPPTMTHRVERDGQGWKVTLRFQNRAGQPAKNFRVSAVQLGEATSDERLPMELGELAPLERRELVFHFKKGIQAKDREGPLLVSFECGDGAHRFGQTSSRDVSLE